MYLFLMLVIITHTQGIRTQQPTTILEILKAFNRGLLSGTEEGVTPAVKHEWVTLRGKYSIFNVFTCKGSLSNNVKCS